MSISTQSLYDELRCIQAPEKTPRVEYQCTQCGRRRWDIEYGAYIKNDRYGIPRLRYADEANQDERTCSWDKAPVRRTGRFTHPAYEVPTAYLPKTKKGRDSHLLASVYSEGLD